MNRCFGSIGIKTVTLLCISMMSTMTLRAQQYEKYFTDETLRIDYTFSGDAYQQQIAVDQLNKSPHWYGKRQRLCEVPIEGNGQIIVCDHHSKEVIYRNSFSTLFQEWLTYDEAKYIKKSFENVFLVPMPKDTVDVTVVLNNNYRKEMTSMTHTVIPSDILIRKIGEGDITPYATLLPAKDPEHCIHIAYISEGYQEQEMDVFLNDVNIAMESLFAHEPFKTMKDRFNIVAVKAPSKDSGTSEPAKGIWKNTALHSHFNTFYSDRYLTTLHLKDLHDWLAGIPYEHIIILVNSEHYGGGGILNSYNLTSTHHSRYRPVVVHEFGHSFCGLGDEYAYESEDLPMYPPEVEPWEPNLTTLKEFYGKWQDMMDAKTPIPTPTMDIYINKVGVYEGGGYSLKGVYRPMQDCRMRTNEYPEFCPVCHRALVRLIDFYTK